MNTEIENLIDDINEESYNIVWTISDEYKTKKQYEDFLQSTLTKCKQIQELIEKL